MRPLELHSRSFFRERRLSRSQEGKRGELAHIACASGVGSFDCDQDNKGRVRAL